MSMTTERFNGIGKRKGFLIDDILSNSFGKRPSLDTHLASTNDNLNFINYLNYVKNLQDKYQKEFQSSRYGVLGYSDESQSTPGHNSNPLFNISHNVHEETQSSQESVSKSFNRFNQGISHDKTKYEKQKDKVWPAWVYCMRYSDRPSSGNRTRKTRAGHSKISNDAKRCRTAFTDEQLNSLREEFKANKYLSESRRKKLSSELDLKESQIKVWFQNKRAKIKKGSKNYSEEN